MVPPSGSVHGFLQTLSSFLRSVRWLARLLSLVDSRQLEENDIELLKQRAIVVNEFQDQDGRTVPKGRARCPVSHVATIAAAPVRHSSSVVAESKHSGSQTRAAPVSEVYGCMRGVKTSPMKLNLVAKLVRGMRVSDAIIQMELSQKKASKFVLTTLLDTQKRAAESYDMNPVDLHVAQSYVGKGTYLKRIRYHGRGMHGVMHKTYSHYFLMLRQGRALRKKRTKEDRKSFKTKKLIEAGPRGIPNSL